VELFTALTEAMVPQALVTMSYAAIARPVAAALPFAALVTGDQVTNGKPHPEPYERACHALGVDARYCVVLEDSETGARAGNAAGAVVVAIPNKVPVSAAPRRIHVASLTELDVPALARLVENADAPA
jgi:beta-phosphoglucomutase-like phosphatase (HAD superfamily)